MKKHIKHTYIIMGTILFIFACEDFEIAIKKIDQQQEKGITYEPVVHKTIDNTENRIRLDILDAESWISVEEANIKKRISQGYRWNQSNLNRGHVKLVRSYLEWGDYLFNRYGTRKIKSIDTKESYAAILEQKKKYLKGFELKEKYKITDITLNPVYTTKVGSNINIPLTVDVTEVKANLDHVLMLLSKYVENTTKKLPIKKDNFAAAEQAAFTTAKDSGNNRAIMIAGQALARAYMKDGAHQIRLGPGDPGAKKSITKEQYTVYKKAASRYAQAIAIATEIQPLQRKHGDETTLDVYKLPGGIVTQLQDIRRLITAYEKEKKKEKE